MSDYVNNALLDASPYKKQADEAKALVSKWDKTGLLDGLNEDFQKSGMATMLENQAKQLISENSATGGGAGTASAAAARWRYDRELRDCPAGGYRGGYVLVYLYLRCPVDSGETLSGRPDSHQERSG